MALERYYQQAFSVCLHKIPNTASLKDFHWCTASSGINSVCRLRRYHRIPPPKKIKSLNVTTEHSLELGKQEEVREIMNCEKFERGLRRYRGDIFLEMMSGIWSMLCVTWSPGSSGLLECYTTLYFFLPPKRVLVSKLPLDVQDTVCVC